VYTTYFEEAVKAGLIISALIVLTFCNRFILVLMINKQISSLKPIFTYLSQEWQCRMGAEALNQPDSQIAKVSLEFCFSFRRCGRIIVTANSFIFWPICLQQPF